ncbi:hypothetical protein ACFQ1M_00700 [Sungkyunkwania multivorans]|uniref:Uncharacterized protein n=1 Tax=Sungkyunkwania multivorans TaxID=1173618 RepID=A0ABW3CSQ6_9FLAO
MEEEVNQVDVREGYNQVLEENLKLDQNVSHPSIDLANSKSIFFVEGDYNKPQIVRVNIESEGYLTVFVKDGGFGPMTTEVQKQALRWIYSPKYQQQDFTAEDASFTGPTIKVNVERHLCGTGLIWCEPFIHEPINRLPGGFFVKGVCETKILEANWVEYSLDNSGRPLQSHHRARYGDIVQFRIKTEGLNGDIISLQFMEDETQSQLEFVAERTVDGELLIDFPVKMEWQARFFSTIEQAFNDYLRITPVIRYKNLRGEEVAEEGPRLTIENQRSTVDAAKGDVVPVGTEQVEITSAAYNPCRFLEVIFKNKDRDYVYFSQNESVSGEPYHMISGSRDNKKEVLIEASDLDVSECELVSDQHKEDKVSLTYIDFNGDTQSEEAAVVQGDTVKHEVLSNLSENTFHIFYQIWPESDDAARLYSFALQTCRHKEDVPLYVHSDIEWKIAFKWNYRAPLAYAWSHTMQPYSLNRGAIRNLEVNRSMFVRQDEALSNFNLTVLASWDGGDSVEVGRNFAEKVRRTLGLFNRVRNLVNDISGEFTPSENSPVRAWPIEFRIDAPSIGFATSYKLQEMTQETPEYVHQVATVGELQLAASPLIGAQIKVDLVQAAANLGSPAFGRVIAWVRGRAKDHLEINFEIALKGKVNVSANMTIHTRQELSDENSGNVSADGELALEIELSAKAGTGDVAGGVFEADVEAGISGTTDVSIGLEVGADKKGVYALPKAAFGGLVVSYTFRGSVRFGFFKRNWDQSPEDSRLLRARELPIEKEDCYITGQDEENAANP